MRKRLDLCMFMFYLCHNCSNDTVTRNRWLSLQDLSGNQMVWTSETSWGLLERRTLMEERATGSELHRAPKLIKLSHTPIWGRRGFSQRWPLRLLASGVSLKTVSLGLEIPLVLFLMAFNITLKTVVCYFLQGHKITHSHLWKVWIWHACQKWSRYFRYRGKQVYL